MSRLRLAVEQIVFARNYTIGLLDQTKAEDWFRQPPGGVSHIAWQVGHLAFAEYRLALWRIRGKQPQDADLISDEVVRLFGPKSAPDADPAQYPSQAEIRTALNRVHEQVLRELPGLNEAELDEPVPLLTRLRRRSCWRFCGALIMSHCGYYGITGNGEALRRFRDAAIRAWRVGLSCRTRGYFAWDKFKALLGRYPLPAAIVVHSVYRAAVNP